MTWHSLFPSVLPLLVLYSSNISNRDTKETPNAIIERAINAYGGETTLRKSLSVYTKTKGVVVAKKEKPPFEIESWYRHPNQAKQVIRVNLRNGEFTMTRVLNGDKAWLKIGNNVKPLSKKLTMTMQQGAYVSWATSLFLA